MCLSGVCGRRGCSPITSKHSIKKASAFSSNKFQPVKGAQRREICRDQTSLNEFLSLLLELWGFSVESGQEQSCRGGWLNLAVDDDILAAYTLPVEFLVARIIGTEC